MRRLTDEEKRWQMEMMLRALPRRLCPDPAAALVLLAEHPHWSRWQVEVPDPLPNHG